MIIGRSRSSHINIVTAQRTKSSARVEQRPLLARSSLILCILPSLSPIFTLSSLLTLMVGRLVPCHCLDYWYCSMYDARLYHERRTLYYIVLRLLLRHSDVTACVLRFLLYMHLIIKNRSNIASWWEIGRSRPCCGIEASGMIPLIGRQPYCALNWG